MFRLSYHLAVLAGASLASARTLGRPSPSAAVQAAQEQLQAAAKEDEAAHDKAGCWCQKNLAEKQQTVDDMQQQSTQLSHDIDEAQARSNQLEMEVKMHSEELDSNTQALAKAEAIRQKDLDKFTEEQQSHTDSIGQLKDALRALNKHGGVDIALLAVNRVTRRMSGDKKGPLLEMQMRLQQNSSPDQISGVLQHMVTTFSGNLQQMRDDEAEAKARHEAIVDAKNQEIQSQRKHMLGKQQRLARIKVTNGFNQDINTRSEKLLEANVALLNALKETCQKNDDSFSVRREAVQAEIEDLSSAQAALAGASLLSVGQHGVSEGAERLCSAAIEIQEKSWKERAQAACKQAKEGSAIGKQEAAESVEELETDIRQAQDEAARKQDDCVREMQGARDAANVAAKEESAEANFVGSEQQGAEEQLQTLTSQSQSADKAKSDYEDVVLAQQKAVQALRVATSRGKESLEYAAGKADPNAASDINKAISQSESLMKEAESFASGVQSKKGELASLFDKVRLTAGKVMIPLRLMKADSEETAVTIKEDHEARAHARAPQCNAVKMSAEVAKLKNYRSLLGRAAEKLAWETLR